MAEESSLTKEDDYVDINQIRELVRVAEESGVGEIVVEEEGAAHRRAHARPLLCRQPHRLLPLRARRRRRRSSRSGTCRSGRRCCRDPQRPAIWYAVTAPMVGTFYAAPAPGEPAFVQVGDEVAANQTLCIVEAMKLMNEITAEEMGTVREVCVEDADAGRVRHRCCSTSSPMRSKPAPAPESA